MRNNAGTIQDTRLLTPDDVVERLRLDEGGKNGRERLRTLRRLGRIGCVKVGRLIRFTEEDVRRFVEAHRREPTGEGSGQRAT